MSTPVISAVTAEANPVNRSLPFMTPRAESKPRAGLQKAAQPPLRARGDTRVPRAPAIKRAAAPTPFVTVPPQSNVEHWTRALTVAVVDVLSGRRELRSLERWMTPRAFAVLGARVNEVRPRGGSMPGWAISSRAYPTKPGHYEFTATVWDQDRARAIAGHIVAFRNRWLVTEIEL